MDTAGAPLGNANMVMAVLTYRSPRTPLLVCKGGSGTVYLKQLPREQCYPQRRRNLATEQIWVWIEPVFVVETQVDRSIPSPPRQETRTSE